jgi:hypothetical protein
MAARTPGENEPHETGQNLRGSQTGEVDMTKWNEPIDPAAISRWQRRATFAGAALSVAGLIALAFSTRIGLGLIGAGALLIYWIR